MKKATAFVLPLVLLVLLVLIGPASGAGEPKSLLPQPNGCYPVGTKTVVLRDAHRNRDLLVTLWYPAAGPTEALAPYMDKKTAQAIAQDWELQPGFERDIRANSSLGPAPAKGSFSVVLLEHGSEMVPAVYSILAEGLASSGFIVVATNHPPDSLIAVFPDGRESRFAPYWPEKASRHDQGVAIGKFAEDVLLADVRFVLDQLQEMNTRDDLWRGHFDLAKIGIVGHSMGGTTASLALQKEPRILAGVNLDGSTYPGMNNDLRPIALHKPYLFLVTPEHAAEPATQVREFVGSPGNNYYVVLHGADHMSFTDKRLVVDRLSRKAPPDDKAFEGALLRVERTRSLVEQFFGKYLKGTPAPELDSAARIEKK